MPGFWGRRSPEEVGQGRGSRQLHNRSESPKRRHHLRQQISDDLKKKRSPKRASIIVINRVSDLFMVAKSVLKTRQKHQVRENKSPISREVATDGFLAPIALPKSPMWRQGAKSGNPGGKRSTRSLRRRIKLEQQTTIGRRIIAGGMKHHHQTRSKTWGRYFALEEGPNIWSRRVTRSEVSERSYGRLYETFLYLFERIYCQQFFF